MSEELPQDNGQELTGRYAVRDPAHPTRSWGGLNCTYQKSGQLLSVTVNGKPTALTGSAGWYTLGCIVYLIDKKTITSRYSTRWISPRSPLAATRAPPKKAVSTTFLCVLAPTTESSLCPPAPPAKKQKKSLRPLSVAGSSSVCQSFTNHPLIQSKMPPVFLLSPVFLPFSGTSSVAVTGRRYSPPSGLR